MSGDELPRKCVLMGRRHRTLSQEDEESSAALGQEADRPRQRAKLLLESVDKTVVDVVVRKIIPRLARAFYPKPPDGGTLRPVLFSYKCNNFLKNRPTGDD